MSSHVNQEGALVFDASSDPPRHISQDGVLAYTVGEAASHISQEGVLTFVSVAAISHSQHEGVLIFRENTPDAVASTGRAYAHG